MKRFFRSAGTPLALLFLLVLLYVGFEWTVNRYYVPEGSSLLLRYKGPLVFGSADAAKPGQFAKVDASGNPLEIGVLEQMRGPGRHFYCPIWWERTLVPDIVVKPKEVALVTSRMGVDLSSDANSAADLYLVENDVNNTEEKKYRGVLRKVYGPGCYRVNPYAYEFKPIQTLQKIDGNQVRYSGWVEVPTGFVGVVTNQTDIPRLKALKGIPDNVLPPGIYLVNPQEQQVDIVEIGLREKSISVIRKVDNEGALLLDATGEPMIGDDPGGISFPSKDGFTIHMDFTAIWGILPNQAAEAIRKFGNIQAVEDKIVVPQIESICRNKGSELGAVELLDGESRQKFQVETGEAFKTELKKNNVTLLYGLVRDIHIPQEIRVPIQQANLADELKLTRDQEQLTAKTEANLREAEQKVKLEAERTMAETDKLVANVKADADKKAAETKAETLKLSAAIDRKTAEIESQSIVTRGKAQAEAEQLMQEAKADKFQLAVKAFGSGQAYNQWVFATGLPDDIKLQLLYAGQGTFWTDLKGFSETMLGRQAAQPPQKPK